MLNVVLGGARSGKSAFAQRLAVAAGRPVLYVATALPSDTEMAARIARHRADRPEGWRTVECPDRLDDAIGAARERETVLLDGLGVWVANVIAAVAHLAGGASSSTIPPAAAAAIEQPVQDAVARLALWASQRESLTIVVTEETGWGVVPAYPLGRLFRDVQGRANQALAAAAGATFLVVAGIGVDLAQLRHRFGEG